ncbi:hypothetical protein ACFYVL_27750 [Streptomyces sp. NPDC004111]|uniref:hypothetical protein n=1 Tax=Streptomyces sp. NPDC004111 TaxID=3364690 RepID=UPI00368F2BEC
MHHATAVHETRAALRTIREQWGELLLAVATPPADVWPPRQLAHTLRGDEQQLVVEDRAPLVLREHPAPLNVEALDAGIAIERAIFDAADTLAAAVQHGQDPQDPRRWTYADPGAVDIRRSHGSRAHGLHYACVWVEGRVLDEDTEPEQQLDGRLGAPPFAPLPPHLLHEVRRTARIAEARLLRTLGLDQRHTPVPVACPWCEGELTLHTGPDEGPRVTCAGGQGCTAPVALDGRVRVWEWGDLPALLGVLGALPAAA